MLLKYHPDRIAYPDIVDCNFQKWNPGCPRGEQAHPIPFAASAVPRALNRGRGFTLTLYFRTGKDLRTAGQWARNGSVSRFEPASIPESLLRDVP